MRLSTTISYFLNKIDTNDAIDILARAGFDALDFGFFNEKYYCEETDTESGKKYFEETRRYAEEKGLVFNQAHAPFPSSVDCPERTREIFANIVRSMRNASLLGIPNIVVHPCQHLNYLTGDIPEQLFEMNMAFYRRLLPYCDEYNINICVENMWRYRAGSRKIDHSTCSRADELVRYLDELSNPRFVACLDIGHAALVCENIPDFIRTLGSDRLRALHVHDVDGMGDTHTVPFCGVCDWDEICAALGEIGYRGDFTYETGGFIRSLPNELLLSGARHLADIGRYLIGKIEK